MTIQKITQKEVRNLFSYNKKTGFLRWKVSNGNQIKIGDIAGTINAQGYIQIEINYKIYLAHRLIWLGVYGYLPKNYIDHKDRIRHHNWLSNLRESTNQCNMRNSKIRTDNTSGIKGVTWAKNNNKWMSQIVIDKKNYGLGYYDDFDDAVCARLAAEQCLNWDRFDSNSSAYQYVKENIQCH